MWEASARRGVGGPCSNTYSGVSDGGGGGKEWMRWDEEVGEVVLEGGGRECTMHGWVKRS